MTLHAHKPLLLGCALILCGTALADDGYQKQGGYEKKAKAEDGYERFKVTEESKAELVALDAGQLDAAIRITLTAESTTKSQSYGTPLDLSSVEREMQNHYLKRSRDVATADQVFELIERTLPM